MHEAGCCGMAGAFGFERGEHYDVAIKAGERVLLPAVRQADDQTLLIADGFSCREQIEQGTDRRALHLAQVLQLARRRGGRLPDRRRPEAELVERQRHQFRAAAWKTAATVAGGALAGAALYATVRRRNGRGG
jgi:hypothetical protein